MDSSDTFQFIILVILLLLSAFFSSAETALMTVNKIRLRSLADDGNRRAALVLDTTEKHTSKMLSAILIGNNIVNISASSLSATLAYSFGGYMVSIATAILTVAILVFGEITPKNFATIHAEKISLAYIPIIRFFMFIMTPIIFLIDLFSRGFMFLLRVDPNARNNAMTEDELRTIVDVSHEDGVIESEEKEMIYNVFDLGDVKAKEVMVPRVHVAFADVNSSYRELIEIFKEYKFTRLPVYEDTTDNVIGTINMKDLLLFEDKANFQVRNILREAYFTYEYKNISELLVEMRDAKFNIAIVLDEYGETAGIITLEDVLEEIVGEIRDEYDEAEEELIHAICSHGYGIACDVKPEHEMEKVLFAVDELTGLVGAAARMRPSHSVMDMEVSSLKKKFKDKKFAAGCSRDVIREGAETLGWTLEELMEKTILAMRSCEESVNKEMEN